MPWFLQFNYLAVFLFIVFTATLSVFGYTKVVGAILVFAALVRYFGFKPGRGRYGVPPPKSIRFYTAWFIWCLITGPFVAINKGYFWANMQVFFMVVICLWCGYILFSRQREDSEIYFAFLTVALINVVAVKMGIELVKENGMQGLEVTGRIIGESRLAGLKGNANGLGIIFLGGVWACVMLWNELSAKAKVRKLILRAFVVIIMILLSYLIGQTGSRKSFSVNVVLWVGWILWILPGRFTANSMLIRLILAGVIGVCSISIFSFFMHDTVVGKRIYELLDAGGGSALAGMESDIRWQFVIDGMRMLREHPLTGVGYMQYIVNSWYGMFAHSDYIEQLASTGIVGFLLYQGFGCCIIVKLYRLLKKPLPKEVAYKIRGMILFMFANHYLMCFGATFATMHYHVLVLLSFDICAERIKREYILRRPVPST